MLQKDKKSKKEGRQPLKVNWLVCVLMEFSQKNSYIHQETDD